MKKKIDAWSKIKPIGSFIGGFVSSMVPSSRPKPLKPSGPYENQEDMSAAVGERTPYGFCSPLTNLWIRDPTIFKNMSNGDAYRMAIREEDKQIKMRALGRFSAFVESGAPYEVRSFPSEDADTITIEDVLPRAGVATIIYPTKGADPKSYHQVGVRKISETEPGCIIFDASKKPRYDTEDCNSVIKEIVSSSKRSKDTKITVASSYDSRFFPSSKYSEKKDTSPTYSAQ